MVAKITTPTTLGKALNYNEKKVQKGLAECLYAGNFLKDAPDMNFHEKLHGFTRLTDLNSRAKTKTLHISLNFDPAEKLAPHTLIQVAAVYMAKIGFGGQPYLVYEHRDAGHPHLHIVTTTIGENGKRINTQNIGGQHSEKARKEIEASFGLVSASSKRKDRTPEQEPCPVQKIRYGKTATKQSITRVVNAVIHRYQYTSLAELNAVLGLYNLVADRGSEESRMYQHKGLVYRVLDERGGKVGVPIKASLIEGKPTLSYLEKQFKKGEETRPLFKQKLRTAIDFTLQQRPPDLLHFQQRLQAEKITVIFKKNATGFLYGLTYIDHRTTCIFNGSDLGKGYSAAAIQERIAAAGFTNEKVPGRLLQQGLAPEEKAEKEEKKGAPKTGKWAAAKNEINSVIPPSNHLLDHLLSTEKGTTSIPYAFQKKKKKRRRGFHL